MLTLGLKKILMFVKVKPKAIFEEMAWLKTTQCSPRVIPCIRAVQLKALNVARATVTPKASAGYSACQHKPRDGHGEDACPDRPHEKF